MRKLLALILGKVILWTTRNLKIGGGSAAPGLWALKVYPQLIEDLASTIPQTVIITGTNGKTTTARLLTHFAQAQGLRIIRNSTGSNLARGIASTLISCAHIGSGKLKNIDLAIWELDEAAFNQLAPVLKPKAVVFLNAFRDQLDRYGEVDTVITRWAQTLAKLSPETEIFLNIDDRNLLQLKDHFQGHVQTFSLESNQITGERTIRKTEKIYPDYLAQKIEHRRFEGMKAQIKSAGEISKFTIPLPGTYNLYNFLAAFAMASMLGIQPAVIRESLQTFSSAFGRGEVFGENKQGYIMLIKNPVGATQVFQTLQSVIQKNDRLFLALNDGLADGTDVSWIWDSDFEKLKVQSAKLKVFVSGTRAGDLAVRLKYAGFDADQMQIEPDLEKAFRNAQTGLEGRLFVLPTYTAMLHLQKLLANSGLKRHYWKEE